MRTDPTENGGLFVGLVLLTMMLICLSFWGPLPAAWFWVGGHVPGANDNPSVAILTIFVGLMACLLIALIVCKRLDTVWILLRRAAGHDQREGMIGKVFGFTCALGGIIFTGWLLLFSGAHLSGGGVGL
jgi:hypothetical protein